MLNLAVGSRPLRMLAAPGQWPLLPPQAQDAVTCASTVLWQRGADPSLLAMLGPHQRWCELSHTLEVPPSIAGVLAQSDPQQLLLVQGPGSAAPDWGEALGPAWSSFETLEMPAATQAARRLQVILTRSHAHNLELARQLATSGIGALSLPTLAFGPAPDPTRLRETLAQLDRFFGVIVSSPRGAKVLANAPQIPSQLKIAAVGASSRAALKELQIPCHLAPERAHSEGLLEALAKHRWLNQRWLHLRGDKGRDVLRAGIEAAQGEYTLLPCYQSRLSKLATPLVRASLDPNLKILCFASGQSYLNYKRILSEQLQDPELEAHLRQLDLLSFGPITSQAIQKDGQTVAYELSEPSATQQLATIKRSLQGPSKKD